MPSEALVEHSARRGPAERGGVAVDDGHVVTVPVELLREPRAQTAAADDEDLHRDHSRCRGFAAFPCYDGAEVRFPFTFMGIMSLVLGVWILLYFLIRQPDGPVSGGIEVAIAFVMIAFGSWVVWRRLTGREHG
jgi:hypothetical protein